MDCFVLSLRLGAPFQVVYAALALVVSLAAVYNGETSQFLCGVARVRHVPRIHYPRLLKQCLYPWVFYPLVLE